MPAKIPSVADRVNGIIIGLRFRAGGLLCACYNSFYPDLCQNYCVLKKLKIIMRLNIFQKITSLSMKRPGNLETLFKEKEMKKMRLAFALLLTFTVGYLYINDFDFVKAARTKTKRSVKRRTIPLTKFLNGTLTYGENPACRGDASLIPPGRTAASMMGCQPGTYQCMLHDLWLLINTRNTRRLSSAFFSAGNKKRLKKADCKDNYTMVKLYSSPEMLGGLGLKNNGKIVKLWSGVRVDRWKHAMNVWLCFDYNGVRYYLNDTNPPRRNLKGARRIMKKFE